MENMFNINDISGQSGEVIAQAEQFLPYVQQKLGFSKPVGVNFISDPENAKDPLGKTGYYDPNKMEITIFVDKRHVKDILRSLSHELVHHAQCCRGEFEHKAKTGPGYAQKNPHMRKMEAEAYLLGNGFLFRDWEDSLKENKAMNENKGCSNNSDCKDNEYCKDGKCVKIVGCEHPEHHGRDCPDLNEENEDLGGILEENGATCKENNDCPDHQDCVDGICVDIEAERPDDGTNGVKNENWTRGRKDQLLFETLIKKWTK